MQVELCRLDEKTADGRIITSEGTTWKNPLKLADIDLTNIGFVDNVRIVRGNILVGDIDFDLDLSVFCLTVGMDKTVATPAETKKETLLYISGRIIYARISPDDTYPWKRI